MDEVASQHFRHFALALERAIAKYGHLPEADVTRMQRDQFNLLVTLEDKFRLALIQHSNGPKVYDAFVRCICDERHHILAARPFFRERQREFSRIISPALKKRNWRRILPCHVNYQFVVFTMRAVKWAPRSPLVKLARQIEEARTELVEMNLPLGISQARLFWSKTPPSHPSFMDFVQEAALGMLSAADKFEPPYTPVFRSVAIGWMKGNFIDYYSNTMLHFYPKDRRKLYRANKFLAKHPHGGFAVEDLVKFINTSKKKVKQKDGTEIEVEVTLPLRHQTTAEEITDLLAGASTVSSDTKPTSEDGGDGSGSGNEVANISRFEAPPESRPDVDFEEKEAMLAMFSVIDDFDLVTRKMLKLKGFDIVL
jgi:RNA polymerase sigma factor (sigma-70 family)